MPSTFDGQHSSSRAPSHPSHAHAGTGEIHHHMDGNGRPADYPPPGLSSPSPADPATLSERPSTDQASGAQYSQGPDVKFNPAATPASEYGMTPSSARSGQGPFPDYAQQQQQQQPQQRTPQQYPDQRYAQQQQQQPPQQQQPQQHQAGHPPNMAHAPNPSIATSSPTYPQQPPHYGAYGHPDMGHYPPPMYGRPGEYPPPQYGQPYPSHYPPPMMHGRPGPPSGGVPMSTVYSFVPIPGTHQQKRPRRRYEEIERMYKCGWNGCEKAYGTLNHLNAHVTMQAHGVKRTPEEFKEIRKEWKQRKKEEETSRKQDDGGRQGSSSHHDGQGGEGTPTSGGYTPTGPRQLPPLGYAPAGGQVPQQYAQPVDGMSQYSTPPVQQYAYSPYGAQPGQMYTPQGHPPPNGHDHAGSDGA